jgi:uncharacterized membrane protein
LLPGVWGIVSFDVHVEAFIPLFFLLSFYFYMKNRRICFLASYITMVSTVETAPFVGISLLLALALYELAYVKADTRSSISSRNARLKILLAAFLITLAFIAFYYYVIGTLLSSYNFGAYSSMPPFLKVVNFLSIQTSSLSNISSVQYNKALLPYLVWWGIAILFFGFGLTGFRNIVISGVLVSPWILQILIIHNTNFGNPWSYYYSYVVGGALVAATLGFMILMRRGRRSKAEAQRLARILAMATILFSVALSLVFLSPQYYFHDFFPSNWTVVHNYQPVENLLRHLPQNSSVMAQPSIAAHLYWMPYIELPPNETVWGFTPTGFSLNINITSYYRVPDYIVINRNLSDSKRLNNTEFNLGNYIDGNYMPYFSSGGFEVYKRSANGSAT